MPWLLFLAWLNAIVLVAFRELGVSWSHGWRDRWLEFVARQSEFATHWRRLRDEERNFLGQGFRQLPSSIVSPILEEAVGALE